MNFFSTSIISFQLFLFLFALTVRGDDKNSTSVSSAENNEITYPEYSPEYIMHLIKCKEGYTGDNHLINKAHSMCVEELTNNKTHNSNLCVSLCTWKNMGYFTEMDDGVHGLNKTMIDKLSESLYNDTESAHEKSDDFYYCAVFSGPKYNFYYNEKCEDVAPFYLCYVSRMKKECENTKAKHAKANGQPMITVTVPTMAAPMPPIPTNLNKK